MDEKLISASRTIKDLGILFEDNFNFEENMRKIINILTASWELLKIVSMN